MQLYGNIPDPNLNADILIDDHKGDVFGGAITYYRRAVLSFFLGSPGSTWWIWVGTGDQTHDLALARLAHVLLS